MRIFYRSKPSTLLKRMGTGIKKAAVVYTAAWSLSLLVIGSTSGALNHFGYNARLYDLENRLSSRTVTGSLPSTVTQPIEVAQAGENDVKAQARQEIKQEMQIELIDSLGKECETKGKKEPEAALVYDSNHEISIGKIQFQVDTVQRYVKKFYNQKIDQRTAILIALDAYPAIPRDELGRKIAFEEQAVNGKGGIYNWKNCAVGLALPDQINRINKITK